MYVIVDMYTVFQTEFVDMLMIIPSYHILHVSSSGLLVITIKTKVVVLHPTKELP
jgi:hypothetical protein